MTVWEDLNTLHVLSGVRSLQQSQPENARLEASLVRGPAQV